jgi:hypothetical protein
MHGQGWEKAGPQLCEGGGSRGKKVVQVSHVALGMEATEKSSLEGNHHGSRCPLGNWLMQMESWPQPPYTSH